jgi:peroxiredoxin Q/BCP
MKPFLLSLCLLASSTSILAQPVVPNPFASFYGVPVTSRTQKASLLQLAQNGQMAHLSLRQLLNGATHALVVAWGREGVLLSTEGALRFQPLKELEAMYSGEAQVPVAGASTLSIENAVQVVPITSLGAQAEVVATYTLRNRGKVPVDVSVASTSCGCTAATLGQTRLEAGATTTLRATMHAEDERMVTVTLKTSDAARPTQLVALQSKRTFAPFALPAPLSLFGEKGEVVKSQTAFELPAGWRVGRVSPVPAWLQSELKVDEKATPRFQLQVTAPTDAPEGAVQGQITLELLDAPIKELTVAVGGFLSNDITATPRLISLGKVGSGVARRTVIVRGPKPFSIRGVRSETVGFKASVDPKVVARAHAVELQIPTSGAVGDPIFGRATLDLSDGRELSIDIFGTVVQGKLPVVAQNLNLGQTAPVWNGSDANEKSLSSRDFAGRSHLLLTFFPRCFTGGCASHLASLRDAMPALKQEGVEVVAVSVDEAEQARAFARELKLPFPLLTDSSRNVALSFGAVQNAQEVPSRLSVLIDKRGVVRWIDTDVQVQTHGADVLTKIRELGLNP